jgi:GntR family transcriptional regulator/MocR family aminotransferase
VLADFIAGGHLTAHVRRTRSLYQERKLALEEACQQTLANLLALQPTETGTQLIGWLPAGIDDQAAAVQAATQGVEVVPLSAYRFTPGVRAGLRLGYAATALPAIHNGVQGLARALESLSRR